MYLVSDSNCNYFYPICLHVFRGFYSSFVVRAGTVCKQDNDLWNAISTAGKQTWHGVKSFVRQGLASHVVLYQGYLYSYKLKRCSKKEWCKQWRHAKFKDTMTEWHTQKTQNKTKICWTLRRNRHSVKHFLCFSDFILCFYDFCFILFLFIIFILFLHVFTFFLFIIIIKMHMFLAFLVNGISSV